MNFLFIREREKKAIMCNYIDDDYQVIFFFNERDNDCLICGLCGN